MTIFPKGVQCNQSPVRPALPAEMNNLTLNKGTIYSPQAWVQYRHSSRWQGSICSSKCTICLRLRQLGYLPFSQVVPPFSPCWGPFSNDKLSRLAHYDQHFPPSFTSWVEFCSGRWSDVVLGQNISFCECGEEWWLLLASARFTVSTIWQRSPLDGALRPSNALQATLKGTLWHGLSFESVQIPPVSPQCHQQVDFSGFII